MAAGDAAAATGSMGRSDEKLGLNATWSMAVGGMVGGGSSRRSGW